MNAGRELDTLVAEKVMGWTRWNVLLDGELPPDGDPRYPIFYVYDNGLYGEILAVQGVANKRGPYWHPSESIADAWDVVEKLRDSGVASFRMETDGGSAGWTVTCWVQFFGIGERGDSVEAEAGTVPHAICLGALLATGALQQVVHDRA
jgi:hypothetical protein